MICDVGSDDSSSAKVMSKSQFGTGSDDGSSAKVMCKIQFDAGVAAHACWMASGMLFVEGHLLVESDGVGFAAKASSDGMAFGAGRNAPLVHAG